MNNIFNLGTRKFSSEEVGKEGVDYKVVKDNLGAEYKILNIENEKYAPYNGIVEIEPLLTSKRHLNNVQWKVVKDKQTGYLVGIPLGFNPKTKLIDWMPLNIRGMETFDLSIPDQRARWICVKYSHFYTKSQNFNSSSKTRYKAIDKEQEAVDFEISRRTKRKAVDIAESLVGQELEDIGLMLGFDPKVMSPKTLWAEVVKFAENPDKLNGKSGADRFLEVYHGPTREELSILKRGISMGVLSQTVNEGINYNGLTLGFNEIEAVKYLKEHPQTAISISTLSKKREGDSTESMKHEAPVKDDKDAQLELMRKRLEEAEARALKAEEKVLDPAPEKGLDKNDEYKNLLQEALDLKIRNAHVIKDVAKLRLKVAEAKGQVVA